jgi:AcrR family transcriptional regulator
VTVAEDPAMSGGIRGRFRAHIRDEVKQVALRQLAEGGVQALSINAIAKELGVSGPALYRYFVNRDELLTELVVDAYHDIAAAVEEAARSTRRQRPPNRLRACATAYRHWATTEPHRYRLLFSAPFPGYDAQSDRLIGASQAVMNVLVDVLAELPPPAAPTGALGPQLGAWAVSRGWSDLPPGRALWAITIWLRLHGLVSLEIEGNFLAMGVDPDLLFDAELATVLNAG